MGAVSLAQHQFILRQTSCDYSRRFENKLDEKLFCVPSIIQRDREMLSQLVENFKTWK